ncbi:dnaJ-like protein 60 isoform X1 [Neodiprion pinetum]|uniref:dnaJ-like protein 60 isoform X1 n=1 Tax=Neodiprion pinetum TaxID=441929 RepID=UPI001EDEC664|nr:dnaJ-like protein 60 isoform X1 [Neodiprion pinetum]
MYKTTCSNIRDVFFLCRCYGSVRNQSNHYDTLCIKNDATQKEIREAFIKLSKELHPDVGDNGSHTKFVKVNEAYRVLSKDYTRQQYDNRLRHGYTFVQHPKGEQTYYDAEPVYRDPVYQAAHNPRRTEFHDDYYGVKGVSRFSNVKIALICVAFASVILALEMMIIRKSVKRSQQYLKNRSLEVEGNYKRTRSLMATRTRQEQIEILQREFDLQHGIHDLGANEK